MNPLLALVARGRRRPLRIVYDEAYRLPISGLEAGPHAMETRRADDALHYLLHARALPASQVVNPEPCSYGDLARVHTPAYLESLHEPATLAKIFAVDLSDVYVDEVLRTLRLGVGGTLRAARDTLAKERPVINLFGGFHHAAPDRGAGFCALNDVAVAIAALRADGFEGRVGVLDFDFHPPDGTAECLGRDPSVWLGSVSGADWGPLPGVDEVRLADGTDDGPYLAAVEALLARMPEVALVFVLAGADVLAGDRLGHFRLSLTGTRRRELLRGTMEREGFFVYPWEWWHFDYKDWRDFPLLDVPFERLGNYRRDPRGVAACGDLELVRPDQFLPILLDHVFTFSAARSSRA